MATQRLTDKAILAARAEVGKRIEIWDEQTPGLCLRISGTAPTRGGTPRQSRVWVWRYRTPDGRQPRLKLSDYSEKHGLKWARLEVEELRVRVRKGDDPAGAKRANKTRARAEPLKTFDDLADAFIAASEKGHWKPRKKQKRPRTIADEIAILRRYVRPAFGAERLEAVDRRMIRRLLTDMIDRGIGAQTNRTHAVIRQVFAYGVDRERLTTNPATGIEKPATESPRARVLSDDELKGLWRACVECPPGLRATPRNGQAEGRRLYVSRRLRIALQLAMLLLSRRNEIAGMAKSELNLEQGTWLIPAGRMKGGRPHLVPLPARATELISEALAIAKIDGGGNEPTYVFPSPRDTNAPIRPDAISHSMAALCSVLGIENASPHDLRRTGSTMMTSERLGISPFVRSQVLGHGGDSGGGAAVSMIHYDANTYVAEKRRAMEAWEGLLLEIAGERPRASNVSELRSAGV